MHSQNSCQEHFFTLSNSVSIVIEIVEYLKHILSYRKVAGFRISANWSLKLTPLPRNNLTLRKAHSFLEYIKVLLRDIKDYWIFLKIHFLGFPGYPNLPSGTKSFYSSLGLTWTLPFSRDFPLMDKLDAACLTVVGLSLRPSSCLLLAIYIFFHVPKQRLLPSVDVKIPHLKMILNIILLIVERNGFIH